jgi:hypothetical protein
MHAVCTRSAYARVSDDGDARVIFSLFVRARRAALLANPSAVAGHSFRIGGATDMAHAGSGAAGVVHAVQPMAFAGAASLPALPISEAPAAFAHRRLERRPDGELVAAPFPQCNVPPRLPFEDAPLADPT